MENSSFHSQLVAVMEVLAKAAVGEINRRVDDSCAVLRLEVRQSRQDIDLLKKKCEVMEAELRRTRMRARRKAAEGFSPLVKEVLNPERPSTDWDRQVDAEAPNHLQQCSNGDDDERTLVKEERVEEAMWTNDSGDKPSEFQREEARHRVPGEPLPCFDVSPQPPQTDGFAEHRRSAGNPACPGSVFPPADPYATFPEHQLSSVQNEADLLVKHEREEEPEEEPEESAAPPLDPADQSGADEGGGQLWPSNLGRYAVDPSFSYAEQQREPTPSVQASQGGLLMEDMAPQIHWVGKSHSVRVKRRARLFGCRRPPAGEAHNTTDQCPIPQQPSPHTRSSGEDPTPPSASAASLCRHGRGSFGPARRAARTPWRPGVGEKRFGCTYCDKSFLRFSQLKEHLRSHTGEKPFSCPLCGRRFTKQCNLIRHAVVHSGEKPYECSLCGKCFTQRSSLKSHQKSAH